MDHWDEVRTAYQVARIGTVSGAAEVLGVHHATVIRHVDALEERLGVRLFQRHARGYTATEAGRDLMQVGKATEDQLAQLTNRIKGQGEGVSGELVVTSLSGLSPVMSPVLADFRALNPGLIVRYLTSKRLFRLEYGEAHVAIRAGDTHEQPDNVVQPFGRFEVCLVASDSYIERYGIPASTDDFDDHWFVAQDGEAHRAPFYQWLSKIVAEERVTYRVTDDRDCLDAVRAGGGIGFVAKWEVARDDSLHRVLPEHESWSAPLSIITHVDLHRTTKVQTFLKFLKERSAQW